VRRDGTARVEHTVVAQPEGADDHVRYRVDQNLSQGSPQEAAHLFRRKVRGQIDGQYEQRYGDGEDAVRKTDDPVVDAPPNPARGATFGGVPRSWAYVYWQLTVGRT
jgi:hypothetical protein